MITYICLIQSAHLQPFPGLCTLGHIHHILPQMLICLKRTWIGDFHFIWSKHIIISWWNQCFINTLLIYSFSFPSPFVMFLTALSPFWHKTGFLTKLLLQELRIYLHTVCHFKGGMWSESTLNPKVLLILYTNQPIVGRFQRLIILCVFTTHSRSFLHLPSAWATLAWIWPKQSFTTERAL